MKKRLLAVAGTLFLSAPVFALGSVQLRTQKTSPTVQLGTTCSSMTLVSATTPTEMTSNPASIPASTVPGISALQVLNISATATVCCGSDAAVSCTPGAAKYANPIPPWTVTTAVPPSLGWAISPYQLWYCLPSAANTPITLCTIQ